MRSKPRRRRARRLTKKQRLFRNFARSRDALWHEGARYVNEPRSLADLAHGVELLTSAFDIQRIRLATAEKILVKRVLRLIGERLLRTSKEVARRT